MYLRSVLKDVVFLSGLFRAVLSFTTLGASRQTKRFSFGNIVSFKDKYLSLSVADKITIKAVKKTSECILECVKREGCVSMNIGKATRQGTFPCEILKKDMFTANDNITSRPGQVHLAIEVRCWRTRQQCLRH